MVRILHAFHPSAETLRLTTQPSHTHSLTFPLVPLAWPLKKCGITAGNRRKGRIPVKTYREILHQYLYHPECKFAGPDGNPCDPWTRGVLQRRHIVAADFKYCGKEVKRKLEQGPIDHETDFNVKVYANGRVTADSETLRALGNFSEREINKAIGLSRRIIRRIRHKRQVKPSTLQKITDFLPRTVQAGGQSQAPHK